ncbi:S8 family serine peptidase [Candidatus Micrarchaeota archaeon]|nr:S8 family serine peptidase [Candidatus Micrarchaeota archaeon]
MFLRHTKAMGNNERIEEKNEFDAVRRKSAFERGETKKTLKRFRELSKFLLTAGLSAFLGIAGCAKNDNVEIPEMPPNATYIKTTDKFMSFQQEGLSPTQVAKNQVLVTFTEEATLPHIQEVKEWLAARGAKHVGQIPDMKMVQYELRNGDDLSNILDELKEKEGVWIASPNTVLTPLLDPNPNIVGDAINGFYWADKIDLREAWDITTGSSEVPIAILDSGIRVGSGHFSGKDIRVGLRCIFEDGTIYYGSDIEPIEGCIIKSSEGEHGTVVGAMTGARGDDGVGGFGIAWKNPLITVDVVNSTRGVIMGDVQAAAELAIRMGAKVMNISLSACHNDACTGQATLEDRAYFRNEFLPAMRLAYKNDVLVVFAAGNDGFKHDDKWLPEDHSASEYYYVDNAILVGATDDWDDPTCTMDWVALGPLCEPRRYLHRCECASCSDLSTLGHYFTVEGTVVELSAPGYRIAMPDWERTDGSLVIGNGTSLSAPMVAGAAALVFGEYPQFRPVKVKDILMRSARKGDGCRDVGAGVLDVAGALELANEEVCYELASGTSISAPDIYENTVVFFQDGILKYGDVQTKEIRDVPATEECSPTALWPHIWENTIVMNCSGTSCDGVCVYRLGEENIEMVDEGSWPGIQGNRMGYMKQTPGEPWTLKMYDLVTSDVQEYILPESFEVFDIPPTGVYDSKITAVIRDREAVEWRPELYIYDFDSGNLQHIPSYGEIGGRVNVIYGDKIVFDVERAVHDSDVFLYDIPSGETTLLADGFSFAERSDIWENKVVFYGGDGERTGLFIADLSAGTITNIFREGTMYLGALAIGRTAVTYVGSTSAASYLYVCPLE